MIGTKSPRNERRDLKSRFALRTFTGRAGQMPPTAKTRFARVSALRGCLLLLCGFSAAFPAPAAESIARVWDEQILSGIRIDKPNPPVNARNLFHLSVAMYDAWAAYDPVAVGYLFHEKHTAADVAVARNEAISYTAYRLLKERYVYSVSASNTLAALDAEMVSLG